MVASSITHALRIAGLSLVTLFALAGCSESDTRDITRAQLDELRELIQETTYPDVPAPKGIGISLVGENAPFIGIGVPLPDQLDEASTWSVETFRTKTHDLTRRFLDERDLRGVEPNETVVIEQVEMEPPE